MSPIRLLILQALALILVLLAMVHASEASELSEAIIEVSKAHGLDPRYMHAIAHLESSSGKRAGLRRNKNGTYDVGPFQINSVHWATTCRDLNVFDVRGNVECAARLLQSHKRFVSSDPHWRGRYHSKTPSRKLAYAAKLRNFVKSNYRGKP